MMFPVVYALSEKTRLYFRIGVKNRHIETAVLQDIQRKMVFIGSPRQCGKTTLASPLCQCNRDEPDVRYLN